MVYISTVWPEPHSSAAGRRSIELLTLFKHYGFEIILASPSSPTERSQKAVIPFVSPEARVAIHPNDPTFDSWISTLQPEIVLFDRFLMEEQFGWRVAEHSPSSLRIIDNQDLHFLRLYRQTLAHSQPNHLVPLGSFDFPQALCHETASRELASFFRADLTLIISQAEFDFLNSEVPSLSSQLFYLPFFSDFPSFGSDPAPCDPGVWRMIGNHRHPPNADAIRFIHQGILPHLPKTTRIEVAGAYPSKEMTSLSHPALSLLGPVEDARDFLRHGALLFAPLRFGAGLKGKLFDALETQTPFVTTSIGAEGILFPTDPLWPLSVADTIPELIQKAVNLTCDSVARARALDYGHHLLTSRFSKAHYEAPFLAILKHHLEHFQDLRQSPLRTLQRTFLSQTLLAARYLSKYIMAKNSRA